MVDLYKLTSVGKSDGFYDRASDLIGTVCTLSCTQEDDILKNYGGTVHFVEEVLGSSQSLYFANVDLEKINYNDAVEILMNKDNTKALEYLKTLE